MKRFDKDAIPMILISLMVFTSAFSCERGRQTTQKKTPPPSPPTLENALMLNIVPLSDGGIYAVNEDEGIIWYVNQNKAVRVKGFRGKFIETIIPAAEGGAYVQIQTDDQKNGLWYLKGDTAIKIQEVPSVDEDKLTLNSRERWLWAMWQHERRVREVAERERKSEESNP